MNIPQNQSSKKALWLCVGITVILTMILWLGIGYQILAHQLWNTEKESLDDFSDSLKAACYHAGITLPNSCEFVSGEALHELRVAQYWILFSIPATEAETLCSSDWKERPIDSASAPIPDLDSETLVFVSQKEVAGLYNYNGRLLMTAPTQDGKVCCYLYLSRG